MNFEDYALSQFEVKIVEQGKYKGKVCFKTPCFNYTLTPELWENVKKKLLEV